MTGKIEQDIDPVFLYPFPQDVVGLPRCVKPVIRVTADLLREQIALPASE